MSPWNTMTLAYYLNTEITEKKGRLGHIWHVLNHCLWFCCRKCKRHSCQPSNLVEWYSPCQEAMLSFRHRHHLLIPGQVHQFGCACMEAPKNELIWPMFSYHLILLTSFPSYQCLFGVFHQLGQHLSRPACSVFFFAVPTPIAVPWKWNQGKRFQMFQGAEKKDLHAHC